MKNGHENILQEWLMTKYMDFPVYVKTDTKICLFVLVLFEEDKEKFLKEGKFQDQKGNAKKSMNQFEHVHFMFVPREV